MSGIFSDRSAQLTTDDCEQSEIWCGSTQTMSGGANHQQLFKIRVNQQTFLLNRSKISPRKAQLLLLCLRIQTEEESMRKMTMRNDEQFTGNDGQDKQYINRNA